VATAKKQHRGQRRTEGVEDAATVQAESQKCPELTKDGDSSPTKSDSRMARSFAPRPRRSVERGMLRPVGCQCRPPSSESLGVTAEGIKAGERRLAVTSVTFVAAQTRDWLPSPPVLSIVGRVYASKPRPI
jgi:hypothetical protein